MMPTGPTYAAAAVIPTFNRKDYLRRAILSVRSQTVPMEIVVVDDGSTDGTPEMMREEFPDIRYERHAGPNGPSLLRNRGSRLATAPILFPIDDDAEFVSRHTAAQTLAEFDHPRVGAVGIPFVNVRIGERVHQAAAPGPVTVTHAYVGAAHAVRRDLFLSLGGYRPQLFYMGEEGDFAVRMLDAGYVVRVGSADPMHHHESPSRSLYRADYYGRRNDVLFAWHNVPWGSFPVHLMSTTLKGLIFGFKVRRPGRMIRGLASGWAGMIKEWSNRTPVRPSTYSLFRKIKLAGLVPLEQIETSLPPMQPFQAPA